MQVHFIYNNNNLWQQFMVLYNFPFPLLFLSISCFEFSVRAFTTVLSISVLMFPKIEFKTIALFLSQFRLLGDRADSRCGQTTRNRF